MKKGLISISIIVGFLFSILMATGVFAADTITLNASNGNVTFNHKKHLDVTGNDCVKCHHTWKKGDTSGKLCVECHKEKAEGKTPSAKDAFHKDCQGCHKQLKEANKPAGPTSCTQCHVKK
ncbi:MAG: cytochrome c3 family protein [Syntrophales bacterium]